MSFVLTRPPQTDDELYELVWTMWGVRIPRTRVCPNHRPPFEAFADAFFARSPISVWKASRGMGGKSRTLAYLALTEAVIWGAEINVLGGSGAQSVNIHDAMRAGWNSPMSPDQMIERESVYETKLTNDAQIKALLASQRSVRGPHPQRLRMDECDEMDISILDSALGQPMSKDSIDTQVVLSSTHQYADGTMSEMLKRAGENGWPVFTWCIGEGESVTTERGDVRIEELRADDRVLTREGFRAVQHLTMMGRKKTIRLTFEDGRTLICTPDHLVSTPDGWVEARSALAVTTVWADVPIGATTLNTGLGTSLGEPSPAGVLAGSNDVEVWQPDTRTVATPMIDMRAATSRDGSIDQYHHQPVDVGRGPSTIFTSDFLDAVPCAQGTTPLDTSVHIGSSRVVSIETYGVMPVYDVGVYGQHEFVVNGSLVHNCWLETSNPTDGWLTNQTIQRTRETVTKRMWEVEYDLQEPSFGDRAIDTEWVDKMFSGYRADPSAPGDDDPGFRTYKHHDTNRGEQYEFEEPDVLKGEYVTGADWAKSIDWTVIATFRTDCKPWRLVAYSRTRRKPYPLMVKLFNTRLKRYPGQAIHDATGLGGVVSDYLEARVTGFVMTGRQRDDMLTEYIAAVEKGELIAPKVETAFTEHKYCSNEDIYGRGSGSHLPDTVCAFALAWHKRKARLVKARPILDVAPEGGSPWRQM